MGPVCGPQNGFRFRGVTGVTWSAGGGAFFSLKPNDPRLRETCVLLPGWGSTFYRTGAPETGTKPVEGAGASETGC